MSVEKGARPASAHAETDALQWFGRVKEILAGGGTVEFSPTGYSMWPALRPGTDMVRLSAAPRYRTGDMVLAQCAPPHGVVLHRIAAMRPDGLVTLAGDSNLYRTETCRTADIIGRVTAILRGGRDVSAAPQARLLAMIQRLPGPLRRTAVRIINLRRNAQRRKH